MQITFNTGRLYTKEGQIITARYDAEEEKVYFCDHSRMIYDQMFDLASTACFPMTPSYLASAVMKAYDHSRHTYAPFDKRPVRDENDKVHDFRL